MIFLIREGVFNIMPVQKMLNLVSLDNFWGAWDTKESMVIIVN